MCRGVAGAEALRSPRFLVGRGVEPGPIINLFPLICKGTSVRGWVLPELAVQPDETTLSASDQVLKRLVRGEYRQHVGGQLSENRRVKVRLSKNVPPVDREQQEIRKQAVRVVECRRNLVFS